MLQSMLIDSLLCRFCDAAFKRVAARLISNAKGRTDRGVMIERDKIVPTNLGDMPVVRIISWNVAGLRGTLKKR